MRVSCSPVQLAQPGMHFSSTSLHSVLEGSGAIGKITDETQEIGEWMPPVGRVESGKLARKCPAFCPEIAPGGVKWREMVM